MLSLVEAGEVSRNQPESIEPHGALRCAARRRQTAKCKPQTAQTTPQNLKTLTPTSSPATQSRGRHRGGRGVRLRLRILCLGLISFVGVLHTLFETSWVVRQNSESKKSTACIWFSHGSLPPWF